MIFQEHALRGGRLDHEHHDMSEQRETATAAMQQAIPGFDGGYRPIRRRSGQAPAGRKIYSFSQKCCTLCNIFVKKTDHVPRCRWRIGLPPGQMSSLCPHRVTRVSNRSRAVGSKPGVCLDNRPDSPAAGHKKPDLFHKNIHTVNVFVKKTDHVPRCRWRIGLPPGQMSSLCPHRVTRVSKQACGSHATARLL